MRAIWFSKTSPSRRLTRMLPRAHWVAARVRAGGWLRHWTATQALPPSASMAARRPFLARLPSPQHAARWVIEEWRVALFAQELRADGAPSAARVDAALRS